MININIYFSDRSDFEEFEREQTSNGIRVNEEKDVQTAQEKKGKQVFYGLIRVGKRGDKGIMLYYFCCMFLLNPEI